MIAFLVFFALVMLFPKAMAMFIMSWCGLLLGMLLWMLAVQLSDPLFSLAGFTVFVVFGAFAGMLFGAKQ